MPADILMPALSPTMEAGALTRWLVKPGDAVRAGDPIAEIETDKATMEVEAVEDGVIAALLVEEGTENVAVNAPIARMEGDEAPAPAPAPPPAETGETAAAEETRKPSATPAPAPSAAAPADRPAAPADTAPPTAPAPAARAAAAPGTRIFASPLARRIAAARGVDLAGLAGSGPHGRIVKRDVEAAPPATAAAPAAAPSTPAPAPAAGDPAAVMKLYADRRFEEMPLDRMRRVIAGRLAEAKATIPHFYIRRQIRLDALLAMRAEVNAGLAPRGIKVSVNDLMIKAAALALRDNPDCNAAWAHDRILRFKAVDIAVAVAIEGGLITPVIRDAETKPLSAISVEMADLAARARDRKLAPHEYQGGGFSISNLGMMGVESFDAVINPPQAAILAVGAGVETPVAKDGGVGLATLMTATLSVDHRVIDGALGAALLASIKGYVEAPLTMLV